jgi:hypothetical protein
MATNPNITLAGGSEAARFAAPPATKGAPSTPVEKAFLALDEALAEASAAIARLNDPMSSDPAHAAIHAEDLKALEAVQAAAEHVSAQAPLLITDRAILTAVRFITGGIRMQTADDRRIMIQTLTETHPIFTIPERGRNARRVAEMIERAVVRLTYVLDALDGIVDGIRVTDQDLVF